MGMKVFRVELGAVERQRGGVAPPNRRRRARAWPRGTFTVLSQESSQMPRGAVGHLREQMSMAIERGAKAPEPFPAQVFSHLAHEGRIAEQPRAEAPNRVVALGVGAYAPAPRIIAPPSVTLRPSVVITSSPGVDVVSAHSIGGVASNNQCAPRPPQLQG